MHIRPVGALLLCAVVWVSGLGLTLDAVLSYGVPGLLLATAPLLVSVVVWILLWRPRVIVFEDHVEVRNVAVTYDLPMACIQDVRLGAMLRFDVAHHDEKHPMRTITAWNAPGAGKDRPRPRLSTLGASRPAGGRPTSGQPRSTSWAERLVQDRQASRSQTVVAAWERWHAREHEPADRGQASSWSPSRRPNVAEFAVLLLCAVPFLIVLAL